MAIERRLQGKPHRREVRLGKLRRRRHDAVVRRRRAGGTAHWMQLKVSQSQNLAFGFFVLESRFHSAKISASRFGPKLAAGPNQLTTRSRALCWCARRTGSVTTA